MKKSVDFIGVGTGPFNLSIAALSHQIEELNCLFFDEHPHFSWHPGMLVPDCHMQTVFLKDLVSAVAPTNPSPRPCRHSSIPRQTPWLGRRKRSHRTPAAHGP